MSFAFLVGKEGRENWVADGEVSKCQGCQKEFSLLVRRHHCRECGKIFCFECSDFESNVHRSHYEEGVEKKKKVCAWCFKELAIRRRSSSNPAPAVKKTSERPPVVEHFGSLGGSGEKAKEPKGTTRTSQQEAPGRPTPLAKPPPTGASSLLFAPFSRTSDGGKQGAYEKDGKRSKSSTGPRSFAGGGAAPIRLSSRQQQQQQQAAWANLQNNHAQVLLAIMAIPEAMGAPAPWEEKSPGIFRDLHTGLRRLSKEELRNLPHREEVLAFLDKFGEKRRTHRNQVLEVKSLLIAR